MKKILSAFLSATLALTLIGCGNDTTVTDNTKKPSSNHHGVTDEQSFEKQTQIVTDENGESSIIEITVAPSEDKETKKPAEDKNDPEEDDPSESDERFEEETVYPIEENPIETFEGAELVAAGYDRMKFLSGYVYTSTYEMASDEEYMKTTKRESFAQSSSDIQYALEVVYGDDVSEGLYYKDGCAYNTVDSIPLKQEMSRSSFLNFIISESNTFEDYLKAFERFETSKDEDGATVTFFGVDTDKLKNFDSDYLETIDADISVEKAEGYVKLDQNGCVCQESINIRIRVKLLTGSYTVTTKLTGKTEKINEISQVDFPSLNSYTSTDHLSGLYYLTNASYEYDSLITKGGNFEIESDIKISGAETINETLSTELDFQYNSSDKTSLELASSGKVNGDEKTVQISSGGKNMEIIRNGNKITVPYSDDLIWQTLVETLEYTLGYASAITDISETVNAGKKTYEYSVSDNGVNYFLDRVCSCLEEDVTSSDIADKDVDYINCVSVLDKYNELVSFTNTAEFSFTLTNGDVYNVQYTVTVNVIS